jgi:peptidylprolyl isomerase
MNHPMKHTILILLLAAGTMAASAQPPAKPAAAAKPASAAQPAPAAKPAAAPVKPIVHLKPLEGAHQNLFTVSLSYQDTKVGTGVAAEPMKLLKYHFTMYLAGDGSEIDSTSDHISPVLDKDKKPVLDADGKPKMGDPEPITMMMGMNRPLPGWDLGFEGMKAGGKRRIYIPWQLGLGARQVPMRDASHPAIPAKSDLILDVDLLDVTDAPPPSAHPGMMPGAHPMPGATLKPAAPGMPSVSAKPNPAPAPPAAAQPQPK